MKLIIFCILLLICKNIFSQNDSINRGYFRVMSYNLENFFDPFNDSLTNDDDFTPKGLKHWTWNKYITKRANIYKVITAIGGNELPEIVGFCEVENEFVINDLLKNTPLKFQDYKIIHKESPDQRGIDVAMLYRTSKYTVFYKEFISIVFPFDSTKKTRDILYTIGYTKDKDTLHIFVNHWPSRLGGKNETDLSRLEVSRTLRNKVDTIFKRNKNPNIIIMGDFNDEPDNSSIINILKAQTDFNNIEPNKLYNLSWILKQKGIGTTKYKGEWSLIDQIMISSSLLSKQNSIYTKTNLAKVFNAEFLSEPDEQYFGFKPFRTFNGYKYNKGFSDHYPIYIDLIKN